MTTTPTTFTRGTFHDRLHQAVTNKFGSVDRHRVWVLRTSSAFEYARGLEKELRRTRCARCRRYLEEEISVCCRKVAAALADELHIFVVTMPARRRRVRR